MTTKESEFTNSAYVKNVDALSKVDNDGRFSTGQKNLLWMTDYDRFAIHSKFEGHERLRIEGGFEVRQFHC